MYFTECPKTYAISFMGVSLAIKLQVDEFVEYKICEILS